MTIADTQSRIIYIEYRSDVETKPFLSTRLVILGLLQWRPLYGYEIKQIIEERMGDWTDIAFGSIYFALDKLTDEGLIERVSIEQKGNRPSRSVYEITDAGRTEFLNLLRQTWQELDRQRPRPLVRNDGLLLHNGRRDDQRRHSRWS